MPGQFYRMAAIGLLVLAAVIFFSAAVVLLTRGDGNAPIQIIAPPAESPLSPAPGKATAPSSTVAPALQVYIQGAVRSPGVYSLQPGDRLVQALEAAGGTMDDADLTAVNLAQRVQDEGYYYIPRVGETPPAASVPGASTPPQSADLPARTGAAGGLIDLNTASVDTLETLPGIGPARAQDIVDYREQNGPFVSVEQVMEVSGIGPSTYETIRELVTVVPP